MKVTDEIAKEICHFVANGKSSTQVSKMYNLSVVTVNGVVNGITHSKVTGINRNGSDRGVKFLRSNVQKFTIDTINGIDIANAIESHVDVSDSIDLSGIISEESIHSIDSKILLLLDEIEALRIIRKDMVRYMTMDNVL